MKAFLAAVGVFSFALGALAADAPAPPKKDLVNPAAYRILVTYDEATLQAIRDQIDKEVSAALEENRRRLGASQDELERNVPKEQKRYEEQLQGIIKAADAEKSARARGDEKEADRWRLVREERTREALDLSRRTQRVEDALAALSLGNRLDARDKEQAIAEAALKKLEASLKQIHAKEAAEVRQRGPGIVPPHE